ncbi:MAG: hypothetical protein ABI569_17405 [Casimicrobiaceae bacterium]
MPNRQRKTVSPRIARMLRELEGPPSGDSPSAFDATPVSGASSFPGRATAGTGRRLIIRAGILAGAAIVTAVTAMQARAPVGDDKQAAASTGTATQHLTDARHATQPARAAEGVKAK